jgi:hypothetical protein
MCRLSYVCILYAVLPSLQQMGKERGIVTLYSFLYASSVSSPFSAPHHLLRTISSALSSSALSSSALFSSALPSSALSSSALSSSIPSPSIIYV